MENIVNINYQIEDESLLPFYAKFGDAGMDVMASEDIEIKRSQTVIIPTGLKVELPIGYEFQVRPRSGISLNTPLRIANSPGTIDCGYRNEIGILMTNISISNMGMKTYLISQKGNRHGTYLIKKGDRIAQLVLKRTYKVNFIKKELDLTNDREGGFGSTGVINE